MRNGIVVAALLAVAALAACGTAGSSEPLSGAGSKPPSDQTPELSEGPKSAMSRAEVAKLPQLTIRARKGQPPARLVVRDLRKGDGRRIGRNDTFLVSSAGVYYGEGLRTTYASRNKPATFSFSNVIPGWRIGLRGMKVGGRRELIVPRQLGDAGRTAIYVVDLLAVHPSQ